MTGPIEPTGTPARPSDAILTIPNLITLARLALLPVFLWLALDRHRLMAAFLLGAGIAMSDLVDGRVARRLNQVSKLGITIDPLFDRFAVAAGAAALLGLHLTPWPALGVVLLRDLALVGVAPLLGLRGLERPPVSRIGKYGSGGTMIAVGLFLASGIDVDTRHAIRIAAWFVYVPAVTLSYLAALGYGRTIFRDLRAQGREGWRSG